jgi:hypothetical protein
VKQGCVVCRLAAAIAAAAAAVALAGCARVKPWQRERLATAAMVRPATPSPLDAGYDAKLTESKTGAGVPGVAAGGGCGCTP